MFEEHNTAFPRMHDLVALLNLCGGLLPELDPLKPRLAHLSVFGYRLSLPRCKADKQAGEETVRQRKKREPLCAQSLDDRELLSPVQL